LITQPGPSDIFAFIDEQEQSIDDGLFIITYYPGATDWYDLPADRHSQGGNLSFLDGHAEHHRWHVPKSFKGYGVNTANPLDLQDQNWLRARLPTK
jgi:prepilin-type processing-associated H-X9-DG protein